MNSPRKLKVGFVGLALIGCTSICAATTDDHLVPLLDYVPRHAGAPGVYDRLCREKLFVTPGLVRFLEQPGIPRETEIAVSMYRDIKKQNGMRGGYWLTVTEPSVSLWKFARHVDGQAPIDTRVNTPGVRIGRKDAPIAETTAVAVHEVWLAMLKRTKSLEGNYSIPLEGSTETFWVTTSTGKTLVGQTPRIELPKSSATNSVVEIAHFLTNYCIDPPAQRAAKALAIEAAASSLQKRLMRN